MRIRKPTNEKIDLPYYDGTRYHCTDIYCYVNHATLREIDGTPHSDGKTYTPILRCTDCGRLYFGLPTYYEEEREEPREPERPKQEQRKEKIRREQPRANEEDSDIILPNVLTI